MNAKTFGKYELYTFMYAENIQIHVCTRQAENKKKKAKFNFSIQYCRHRI